MCVFLLRASFSEKNQSQKRRLVVVFIALPGGGSSVKLLILCFYIGSLSSDSRTEESLEKFIVSGPDSGYDTPKDKYNTVSQI